MKMKFPNKNLEHSLFKKGYKYICAIDEVGMGSLAGPVVTCAVGVSGMFYKKISKELKGVRDSKLLNGKQRIKFAKELLKSEDFKYKIGYSYPETIDRLNIYKAARVAMRRAILRLVSPKSEILNPKQYKKVNLKNKKHLGFSASNLEFARTIVLVDGPHKIPKLNLEQIPVIKGDRKVFAIACASIVAKVYRDKMMARYGKRFPGYGFETHKGYGTKLHRARLANLGPCAIHRKSFRLSY